MLKTTNIQMKDAKNFLTCIIKQTVDPCSDRRVKEKSECLMLLMIASYLAALSRRHAKPRKIN